MFATLLRRWASALPLFLFVFLAGGPAARASHLLGGEMSYRYLDANGVTPNQFRYEVTLLLYRNAYAPDNPSAAPSTLPLSLYTKAPSGTSGTQIQSLNMPRVALSGNIVPAAPAGCALLAPPRPFQLGVYHTVVGLPYSASGYYGIVSTSARNYGITNISTGSAGTPLARSFALYLDIAPPTIPNSSPVFSDTAVAVICQGDTSFVLNNAADADGDRLVYAFGTPSDQNPANTFTPPLSAIPYNPGYSVTQPFGAGGFVGLDTNTGLGRYCSPNTGIYVVAVEVSEYRTFGGVDRLISTSRRDIQLVVQTCPPHRPPSLSAATGSSSLRRNYTVEEGTSLTIPLRGANNAPTDPLALRLNSVLLDGTGGFDAALNGSQGATAANGLTGTATVVGTATVTGNFVYNAHCGDARATAYDVVTTVQDRSCSGRTIADVFRVTVNRLAAPVITQSGNVLTSSAATGYQWFLGGTAIAGATGSTYTATGPGTYTVVVTNANNCSSSASRPVLVTASRTGIAAGQFTLYPNPTADGRLTLALAGAAGSGACAATVQNLLGATLLQTALRLDGRPAALDLSALPKGVYVLRLRDAQGRTALRRVVRD